jgi:SulP family sulfate permease
MELAGSLGDLGTLLPLGIGMIVINGLNPTGLLFIVGTYYILSGLYFGVTVPVQPMKVIGAYSIAMALTPGVITASGLLMGMFMLVIGITGAIHVIGKYTPKSVVRGVQLAVGTLLMVQGLKFMLGISKYQEMRNAAEPYLTVQAIGPVPVGIMLGIVGSVMTFLLLENKKIPAALVVILGGMLVGIFFGTREGFGDMRIGLHVPPVLPFGIPTLKDFSFAFFILVLPQIPMTIGNAVIANADLTREYFGEKAKMASYRALSNSMGIALLGSSLLAECLYAMGPVAWQRIIGSVPEQPVQT